ncbi:DUF1810 domain-containing protein [Capnocytophaga canimorsus]|uniref:DUF1810 domain-containing protein n=1 Tax=Capnocytophaga canimorsus TaxID=28188 RepID=UPI0037D70A22
MENGLNRFLQAQEKDYLSALSEVKSGRKKGRWMWYVFPQFKCLALSESSKSYGIDNVDEAEAFLHHPVLGTRLKEMTDALLNLSEPNVSHIFGSPDEIKLKASMTLFACVSDEDENPFKKVIDKYFQGALDTKTTKIIDDTWVWV